MRRKCRINLPDRQSAFLWGARQTGKSSFLKQHFKNSVYYDLLLTHEAIRLEKTPCLLREEILALSNQSLARPVVIDEIHKVPSLLDEVHWLIENAGVQFILCDSNARKLKTHSTNLLGGRAWVYHFYPFVSAEIPDFSLLTALQQGLIPNHYQADPAYIQDFLQAYVDIYLTDEIRNEGLVRNFAAFARFLDLAGLCNAEMVNANNIARNCGVERTTVQGFYQILIDTWLGYYVYPYNKKIKRDIITSTPKFYLFDVGIANYLAKQQVIALKGAAAGKSFEHFIFMELTAYIGLYRKHLAISYWRTKTGLEVDFILGEAKIALEVKLKEQIHKEDLKGLIAFCTEHPHAKAIVVSQDERVRMLQINDSLTITILPWKTFLKNLWEGEII